LFFFFFLLQSIKYK